MVIVVTAIYGVMQGLVVPLMQRTSTAMDVNSAIKQICKYLFKSFEGKRVGLAFAEYKANLSPCGRKSFSWTFTFNVPIPIVECIAPIKKNRHFL